MRVNIGPYRSDIIPISKLERRYEVWRSGELYLDEKDYTWYDKIVLQFLDWLEDLVRPINHWNQRRTRKVEVHVDYYDVWSADHTLGLIIAPLLKKLKEVQHGMPHVDNEDVPESLRFDPVNPEVYSEETDNKHQARWDYVLDEMIWAFECYSDDDDTQQFYHNVDQLDMIWKPAEDYPGGSTLSFNYQKDPNKPAYYRDEEGIKKHHERKKNGLRLFAKYYESLWD